MTRTIEADVRRKNKNIPRPGKAIGKMHMPLVKSTSQSTLHLVNAKSTSQSTLPLIESVLYRPDAILVSTKHQIL